MLNHAPLKKKKHPVQEHPKMSTRGPQASLTSLCVRVQPPNNWVEEGLPKLVDDIISNYQTFGGMDHFEGKDLPSKKVVIEVFEDLLTVFFPGYLGKTEITKAKARYVLGNTLISVYTRLTAEVEKSLKHICRKVKECPQDICHAQAQVIVKELLEKIPEIRQTLREDVQAAYD
jgi:serine O-acetyltransferase